MQRRDFLLNTALGGLGLFALPSFEDGTFPARTAASRVINAGVGGDNTRDLLRRIDKDCLAQRPGLVVLMVGTNDMNSRKYVPLEEYRENLVKIIKMVKKQRSKVLLMTILPFYEPYLLTRHPASFYGAEGPAGRRAAVNGTIAKVAREQRVSLLDMGGLFERAGRVGTGKISLIRNEVNSHMTDGIHPTPEGYRFMGLAVYDHIRYNGLIRESIVCFGDSITHGDGGTDKESYPAYLKRLLA
ncbi:SGNH/GDSL hydrolase family protein [Compostibacter hankyongensis]|uniref:SGNH hydrolase-type esterase domain-containing protein n=1 Tax=Compostibacter hankyongensis TaxID=1007089 RepID=A0ABP8FVI5_9BACT